MSHFIEQPRILRELENLGWHLYLVGFDECQITREAQFDSAGGSFLDCFILAEHRFAVRLETVG